MCHIELPISIVISQLLASIFQPPLIMDLNNFLCLHFDTFNLGTEILVNYLNLAYELYWEVGRTEKLMLFQFFVC